MTITRDCYFFFFAQVGQKDQLKRASQVKIVTVIKLKSKRTRRVLESDIAELFTRILD